MRVNGNPRATIALAGRIVPAVNGVGVVGLGPSTRRLLYANKSHRGRSALPWMKRCGFCRLFTFRVITKRPNISYDGTTARWRHNDHPQHYGKMHCIAPAGCA